MRVIVLEPSAVEYDRTHNFNSILGYTRLFLKRNIATVWATNHKCRILPNDIENYPLFAYTIYDDAKKEKRDELLRIKSSPATNLFEYAKEKILLTWSALNQVARNANVTAEDHIFAATADWILFNALMRMITDPTASMPYLHLRFLYETADWMTGGYPYEEMLSQLKEIGLLNKKLFVYTETKAHARKMSRALGIPVERCMSPVSNGHSGQPEPKLRNKFSVLLLGGGRRDKGFHLLPDIIHEFDRINRNGVNVEFVVQKPRTMDNLENHLRQLQGIPKVKVKANTLGKSEYENCLQACDCMLFPYDKGTYEIRGSGIVSEAVAAGKPFICTRGTALEESITHGNGLVASSAAEFAHGILRVAENTDLFIENAVRAADDYQRSMIENPIIRNVLRTQSGMPQTSIFKTYHRSHPQEVVLT